MSYKDYDYETLHDTNNDTNYDTVPLDPLESTISINEDLSSSTEVIVSNEVRNDLPRPKSKRLYWADFARIFSMICIVLLHSASFDCELGLKVINDSGWVIVCFYNCVTRFSVPMFVLLSGTFILDPSRKFSFKKLFGHNILRLATAFAFWSSLNAIYDIFAEGTGPSPSLFSSQFISQFIKKFIVGEEYLWFIYMIIGCYLISPFLRYFSDDIVNARYFLGLCVFWGSLIPTLQNAFAAYNMVESQNELNLWISRWHYHFTLEFVGYFVAGYHIVKHVNIKSAFARLILYVLGMLDFALLFTLTVDIENDVNNNVYSHHFRGTNTLTVVFYTVVLFIFFKYEIGIIRFSEKAKKIISKWSSLTFGMYLSHLLIKRILVKFFHISQFEFFGIKYSPVFGVPFFWIILVILSTSVSYLLSITPVLNKYVL